MGGRDVPRETDDYLTPAEAAAILKVSVATVWRKLRSGELPATKFGRSWRIKRRTLDEMLTPRPRRRPTHLP